ncbi:Nitroreductase [Solimonas aquatica]|uniref:Nitroreductase n=1 Tax=Solimonas aquatica TaxID=489703 RepID=A0A1H9LVE7_9GAMM|nr:nitroreductase family protein [Solimonas aquatica]SER15416.1 Nitroreductase [Solimonas aquatica]
MKLLEAIAQRRAVRDFLPEAVQAPVLSELLDIACQAPSHMNAQPWSFVVLDEPARVALLSAKATQALRQSLVRSGQRHVLHDEIMSPEFDVLFRAPALIVVCATQPGSLADMDCAMAAYNIMLAAHSMGLGSCWVSMAQPFLDSPEGRRLLHLNAEERVVAPLVLGAPSAEPVSPGRFQPKARWLTS